MLGASSLVRLLPLVVSKALRWIEVFFPTRRRLGEDGWARRFPSKLVDDLSVAGSSIHSSLSSLSVIGITSSGAGRTGGEVGPGSGARVGALRS